MTPRKFQPHPQMTELLSQFPSIYKTKLDYWPHEVDEFVLGVYQGCSSGEKRVIEFLLSVWDHNRDWALEGYQNFNLARAVAICGSASKNIDAIKKWMDRPFHP